MLLSRILLANILTSAFFLCYTIAQSSNRTVRFYSFNAKPASVQLGRQLPSHSQIHKTWPRPQLRVELPASISAVVVSDDEHDPVLVGPPIHVQAGDRLKLQLKNSVPLTGLSIHLHGLGYGGAFEYDGAVGVSQCPLAEGQAFVYDVVVDEAPGTYWYHTSSGHSGVDAYDAVRGPLVVHPAGSKTLVDTLNGPSPLPFGYSPLAYEDERLLFFQDGSLSSGKLRYSKHIGNLLPPPSKSDDGTTVATSPWHFGTCNGKLRDVVHVAPNQKYKFRVINGGQHDALRVSIDGFPMTVVAADSQPVEPYTVDEIVLHVGERFDVELIVYDDIEIGESFWIRADTLESQSQGFQNGIRAIMRVSDVLSIPRDEDVADPTRNIATPMPNRDTKTLNCHSGPGCIPITFLSPLPSRAEASDVLGSDIHFVDTHFQPAPQYGHFVSIDNSAWTQNEFPPAAMISRTYRPDKSVHPNSLALRVSNSSSVVIVWRTTEVMDVPIHIHGHTVEILDIALPEGRKDCSLVSCRLSSAYNAEVKLKALDKTPQSQTIKKDTFVIPAGGALVTRMQTGQQGLWMVSGQRDIHQQDGLSLVLIVGDYTIPQADDWLPVDFPTCNSTLVEATTLQPHCECYLDKGAPFQRGSPEKKYCSRSHLCRHELSQAANLDSYLHEGGFNIQSGWAGFPDEFVSALFLLVVTASTVLVVVLAPVPSYSSDESQSKYGRVLRRLSSLGIGSRLPQGGRRSNIVVNVGSSGETSSIPGLSVLSSEHIGTIHIHQEEAQEEQEEEGSMLDADRPPPPPTPPSYRDSKRRLPPLPPTRRPNSQTSSAGDLFVQRKSTSTFERIFSERGDRGKSHLNEAFELLLDGYSVRGQVDIVPVDTSVHRGTSFTKQMSYIFATQWQSYFPSSVNLLRFVEVIGLAAITGGVFKSTGGDNSQATIAELSSLVLVLTTMFTFGRLFFAIHSQHEWFKSIRVVFKKRRFSLLPVFTARMTIVALCECIWPTIAVFVCFPVAGLSGDMRSLCNVSALLAGNNMCYILLGNALGMITTVPHATIAATVFSQLSILVSGIFTTLPPSLAWARFFSPFYWTVNGLLKSVFRWSDTYECVVGSSSDIGADQCYVEFDGLIDRYKRQGLDVATYNDPSSDGVVAECITLVALACALQAIIFCRCFFAYYKVNWEFLWDIWPETW